MVQSLEEVLFRCHMAWARGWPPTPVSSTAPSGGLHLRLVSTVDGAGTFSDPLFSLPLPDGGLIVSDYGNHQLKVVSAGGQVLHVLGSCGRALGEFVRPRGLALTNDALFVVDDTDRVHQLDLKGVAVGTFPPRGVPAAANCAPVVLCRPHGVARAANGMLYVTDTGNQRVVVFKADGELAFAFGRYGTQLGCFDEPRGLCVTPGVVWVADMCNHRLQAFGLDGRPLRTLGQHGDAQGQFQYPVGVGAAAGRLFVSEYTGRRLQVLSLDGAPLQVVPAVRLPPRLELAAFLIDLDCPVARVNAETALSHRSSFASLPFHSRSRTHAPRLPRSRAAPTLARWALRTARSA